LLFAKIERKQFFSEEKNQKTFVFCCLVGLLMSCAAVARAEDCPPKGDMPIPLLPHTRAALATNQPLVAVALGSSSTRGWMSTNIAHSYPALLQRELNDALPKADFAFINRGVGGQDAPEELARMDSDVIAIRPQLVIWQVGANGAVHDESPLVFKALVEVGIEKLKTAGADVILMDNQRSPRIMASPEHNVMDEALADVAKESGVNLFSRGTLMDHWAAEGAPYEDFIAVDGFHMNNRGYACLAQAMADVISTALKQPIAQQNTKGPK
jgi:lysophospholipase L1-like esterase